MIANELHNSMQVRHIRWGDALVFGGDSDVRRKLSEEQALQRFAEVWTNRLEGEIRTAPLIPTERALELLEERLAGYLTQNYQFREFSLHNVVFIARLNKDAGEVGTCDQLWSLSTHRDNTRLCVFFDTIKERKRFEAIARNLGSDSKVLGLELITDFIRKFPTMDGKNRVD